MDFKIIVAMPYFRVVLNSDHGYLGNVENKTGKGW